MAKSYNKRYIKKKRSSGKKNVSKFYRKKYPKKRYTKKGVFKKSVKKVIKSMAEMKKSYPQPMMVANGWLNGDTNPGSDSTGYANAIMGYG